jgi:ribosomal protein S18 acetylase RimI-like enzyme
MEYRIATEKDIDLLLQSRLDTLRDVNGLGAGYRFSEDFEETSRRYFLEGDQETVLAEESGRVFGCASMCYISLMPTFSHPAGKRAHLMNVWTDPSRRREGIAARMVSLLIGAAWKRGVTEISLDATEAGKPLYRKLGFHGSQEHMVLEKQ